MLIQCSYDLMPCPPEYQLAAAELTLETFVALGITPTTIATAYTVGFGLVLMPALLGYVINIVRRLINQL